MRFSSVLKDFSTEASTSMPCSIVKHIGEGFHINVLVADQLHFVEVDADHWKTWVHHRLHMPLETPGALSLYHAPAKEHLLLAEHLTAETKTEEFIGDSEANALLRREQRSGFEIV